MIMLTTILTTMCTGCSPHPLPASPHKRLPRPPSYPPAGLRLSSDSGGSIMVTCQWRMKLLTTTIMMYCYQFYINPANITQPVVHAAPVYTYPAYPDPCRFPMPHHSKPNQSYLLKSNPLKSKSNIHATITTLNAVNPNQTKPNKTCPTELTKSWP